VSGVTRFIALYDGDGVRVQKTDTRGGLGLQVHDYSYGPMGLLHESNPNTVYTPGFGHRSNGINKFYHTDWIGSTRYTSDSTGNSFPAALRYDAYGNRSATGGTDPYHSTDLQFAGEWGYQTKWASATDPGLGLQYLEQRYYDPMVGRFLTPDPIDFEGGLNLYAYTDNDPVNEVDPLGLSHKFREYGMGGGWLGPRQMPVAPMRPAQYYGMRMPAPPRATSQIIRNATRAPKPRAGGGAPRPASACKVPNANSRSNPSETHVYKIKGPEKLHKAGISSKGTRVKDGASKRAESQARKLRRETGDVHETKIIKVFPNRAQALDYERKLIERYSQRYGRPPGNPVNR
jgi:RHS repeat-associated protein